MVGETNRKLADDDLLSFFRRGKAELCFPAVCLTSPFFLCPLLSL